MFFSETNRNLVQKLISVQVEQVTCLACCKYYIAPEIAVCGHSLCHSCWSGRKNCLSCSARLDRRSLKLNLPLQLLTEHVHALGDAFEKLFNMKLEDFPLGTPKEKSDTHDDPTKNVKDWLASSQNQFSAANVASEPSQDIIQTINLSTDKIQIHHNKSKIEKEPKEVVHAAQPQDDWDKIEQLPESEEIVPNLNKENVIGPMDIEPFLVDENEYTTDQPRRSSRKRILKYKNDVKPKTPPADSHSSKNSSNEIDKKSKVSKQNWSNVKKMRKEFSKLNKLNKSKLNISIEMCKKTKGTLKKQPSPEPKNTQPCIDDDTPDLLKSNNSQTNNRNGSEVISHTEDDNQKQQRPSEQQCDIDYIENNIRHCDSENIILKNPNVIQSEKKETTSNDIPNQSGIKQKFHDSSSVIANKSFNMPFFKKGPLYPSSIKQNSIVEHNKSDEREIPINVDATNNDDIEIAIKIGNTLTNILIKKKQNNVQLKVNTDREVQASLGPYKLIEGEDAINSCQITNELHVKNIEINIGGENDTNKITSEHLNQSKVINVTPELTTKSTNTKKNTASADTATAQFEITESVEKEISNVMDCVEKIDMEPEFVKSPLEKEIITVQPLKTQSPHEEAVQDMEFLKDVDIFASGSVKEKEPDVQLLSNTKPVNSEICISKKLTEKRVRDVDSADEVSCSKKVKVLINNDNSQTIEENSENINYDKVMSQAFANIDADILEKQSRLDKTTQKAQDHSIEQTPDNQPSLTEPINLPKIGTTNEKYSENIFSIVDKDDSHVLEDKEITKLKSTQEHIDKLLTPGMCRELTTQEKDPQIDNVMDIEEQIQTPQLDSDDSDKSVVEETPQKNLSFAKLREKCDGTKILSGKLPQKATSEQNVAERQSDSQIIQSIINISDTADSIKKNTTIVENIKKKQSLETPLTINKFVDHIKHKSTPVARKSLNFDSENIEDPERTLCPSTEVAKTTQEKEFMTKAFEESQPAPIKKPVLLTKNIKSQSNKAYCIAGSCLTFDEIAAVKRLCADQGWTFVDKYTNILTHLVVGVDHENKAQRSVKYMCALAASKWIVSCKWIEKCLQMKCIVYEEPYEVLDAYGEPGPRQSRLAKKKLFEGIMFYCMPPFSVLDVNTLEGMLEAAGGTVVKELKEIGVNCRSSPRLLLAEPEQTQEDRFLYMCVESRIVPVNYEWALNCLGSYSLCSIQELLLCPSALLPKATLEWPPIFLQYDDN